LFLRFLFPVAFHRCVSFYAFGFPLNPAPRRGEIFMSTGKAQAAAFASAPSASFVRLMFSFSDPSEDSFEYWMKSMNEPHERVARESELRGV
jgi:hypothetical protein